MNRRIYFDHNATCPLKPEVRAAMLEVMSLPTNASSIHAEGREARRCLEAARLQVAGLVAANPKQVFFTSGATEANNWVLRGIAAETGRRVVVSAIEHPSVLSTATNCTNCSRIPVTADGVVDLAALEAELARDPSPAMVSVMLVNNETGVIQPVREAAEIAHRHGALMHGDAVQAAGRIPLDLAALGLDYLTLSGHKLGGPQGIGALIIGAGHDPAAWVLGGTQENRRRAGTENVAGAVGFGMAANLAARAIEHHRELAELRDRIERELLDIAPDLVIAGKNAPRVGNTTMLGVPGLPAETQIMALDMAGIAVSSGAACSSGKGEPSAVLTAMGFDRDLGKSAIRISLGWTNTADDVAEFVANWQELYRRHAARTAAAS